MTIYLENHKESIHRLINTYQLARSQIKKIILFEYTNTEWLLAKLNIKYIITLKKYMNLHLNIYMNITLKKYKKNEIILGINSSKYVQCLCAINYKILIK